MFTRVTRGAALIGAGIEKVLFNTSATVDPSSVAGTATGGTAALVAMAGVAFGDDVMATPPYDMTGVMWKAYVPAAGSVGIMFTKCDPAGTVDLASGIWRLVVKRYT